MFDPGAPSSVLAIAELNKPGTMHEIHGIALLRSGHEEDAKDLAMVSIARVLDPDDLPWHLGGHTFLVHMFSVVRQTWYRQRRKRSARSEVPDGGEAQDNTANDGELPDAEVARKREFETRRSREGRRRSTHLGRLARQQAEIP
jgi:DNA-directed RNA polymerase specialized sigma24 family protein